MIIRGKFENDRIIISSLTANATYLPFFFLLTFYIKNSTGGGSGAVIGGERTTGGRGTAESSSLTLGRSTDLAEEEEVTLTWQQKVNT